MQDLHEFSESSSGLRGHVRDGCAAFQTTYSEPLPNPSSAYATSVSAGFAPISSPLVPITAAPVFIAPHNSMNGVVLC